MQGTWAIDVPKPINAPSPPFLPFSTLLVRRYLPWLLLGVVVVALLARDRIQTMLPKAAMDLPARTTNSQVVATEIARTSGAPRASNGANNVTGGALVLSSPASVTTGSTAGVTPGAGTPAVAAGPAAANSAITYEVKKGDTLYSIAQRFDVPVKVLIQTNGIVDPNVIKPGAKLRIPVTPAPAIATVSAPAGAVTYKVQRGDTLASIAREFGVGITELQKANNLANPNDLATGVVLIIPGAVAKPAATIPAAATSSGSSAVAAAATAARQSTPAGTPVPPTPARRPVVEATSAPAAPAATAAPPAQLDVNCPLAIQRAVVWGAYFCQPEDWSIVEQGPPERGVYMLHDEVTGERSLYAIVRTGGVPNPPLSLALSYARGAALNRLGSYIPKGLAPISSWSDPKEVRIGGEVGRMTEARTTYVANNAPARVRLVIFKHKGQPWELWSIAPEVLWSAYAETIFAMITDSVGVQ